MFSNTKKDKFGSIYSCLTTLALLIEELENFLFKSPEKMNIIEDGTRKSKKIKKSKNEHYDFKTRIRF